MMESAASLGGAWLVRSVLSGSNIPRAEHRQTLSLAVNDLWEKQIEKEHANKVSLLKSGIVTMTSARPLGRRSSLGDCQRWDHDIRG